MDPLQIPSADLAYLGDAVFEVLVRERLIKEGHSGAGRLNRMAMDYVTAVNQSAAADRIISELRDDESDVFRRARNQSKAPPPPSATVAQYRKATAFEALFAYLWLCGKSDRAHELFEKAFDGGNTASRPEESDKSEK
jgi:ribonuclease III family protein